jgi:hypothetical protein
MASTQLAGSVGATENWDKSAAECRAADIISYEKFRNQIGTDDVDVLCILQRTEYLQWKH